MRKVGAVEVYPIKWKAWREVKLALASLLGSRLVPEALAVASRVDEAGPDQAAAVITSHVSERLSGLSDELGQMIVEAVESGDRLAQVLIDGCTSEIDWDQLAAADALEIARACIDESDLPTLLEREKNFWGAVFGAATARLQTGD